MIVAFLLATTLATTFLRTGADSSTSTFDVGGLRVILRHSVANDVVAANLYLLGGTSRLTDSTAGIETFLLAVSERGTRHYSRDALRRAVARTGAAIVIEPASDWTMFGVRTLAPDLDSTWAVFADRVMHPTLDSADVEFARGLLLTSARQRRDSPDELLQYLADSSAFAGHPYALDPTGTERSLARITPIELRRYHAAEIVTSRMLLVVVGNVTRPKVEQLVRRTLATLPRGSYTWTLPPPLPPASVPSIVSVSRPLPTNYLLGYYAGAPASSSDFAALRVAAAVLSGRLFTEIRARRNLTYAIDAPFLDRGAGAGGFYVTTTAPDSVLALTALEVHRLQTTSLVPEQLERLVAQFVTTYFLDNETNAAQATFLARNALYRGDYRAGERFVQDLRRVTPADVRRVAQKYIHGTHFAFIGDPALVSNRSLSGL
ncbi:MAG: pitrilysin family protein [Gemmatimonadaceae bacterium]